VALVRIVENSSPTICPPAIIGTPRIDRTFHERIVARIGRGSFWVLSMTTGAPSDVERRLNPARERVPVPFVVGMTLVVAGFARS